MTIHTVKIKGVVAWAAAVQLVFNILTIPATIAMLFLLPFIR